MQDLAENHLDGEFYGSFPSGNGINGSDFVAELQAYHNKVFAPQTIIGTANAANGGVGGARVNPVHSGVFVPAIPRGDARSSRRPPARSPRPRRRPRGKSSSKPSTAHSLVKHHATSREARQGRAQQEPSQGTCAQVKLRRSRTPGRWPGRDQLRGRSHQQRPHPAQHPDAAVHFCRQRGRGQ